MTSLLAKCPEHGANLINLLIGNVFKEGVDGIYRPMSEFANIPPPIYEDAPVWTALA